MQPTLQQWLARSPAGPKPRKRVRKVSAKRQREARAYRLLRAAFLQAHPYCQAWLAHHGCTEQDVKFHRVWVANHGPDGDDAFGGGLKYVPHSEDVHHKAGRRGGNYLNTDTWLAVCRDEHDWIHAHPKEARQLGLLT